VKDGDKLLVPKRAPAGAPGAPRPGGGEDGTTLVNLNAATAADLETLPGIGPALAERIIAYRTEHGGFRRVEDLLEVAGIGPKKFDDLKDRVTV
jgi:competence protein ComEA